MAVDTFTEGLRIAVFAGVAAALVYSLVVLWKHEWHRWQDTRHYQSLYDWERDGECDNRSHPRVLP